MMATQDEVAVLREDVAEVKRDVAAVRGEVAEVKRDVAAVRGEVAEVKREVAALGEGVAEVKREVAAVREDVADVKREMVVVRKDLEAHEERVEARFALMEERMKAWGQELRAHFETEIRRAITVQTLIQTATMVGLVWAARG